MVLRRSDTRKANTDIGPPPRRSAATRGRLTAG